LVLNRRNEKSPKIAPKITTKAKKSDLERRTSAALRAAGLEQKEKARAGEEPRPSGQRARAREREGKGTLEESRRRERERAVDILVYAQ